LDILEELTFKEGITIVALASTTFITGVDSNIPAECAHKPVLLLKDDTVRSLQSDLAGKLYKTFDPHDPECTIPDQLTNWLSDNGLIVPTAQNS
jgi:hypothetical protein